MKKGITYKHSSIPWLGDVPAHWEVRRIKDVSTCNDETLSENTDADFSFQYIDISTVSEGKIGKPQQFTFGKAPSRARRITRPNDVLVSTVRTYLKAIAKVDDVNGLIASTGFAVLRAKTIDPSFFSYALMNDMFAQTVAANSVGVSYPAINASDLVNLSIPLPPLAEQRAIAAFLDEKTAQLDGAIESVEKSVELLRELRAATISEAVTRGLNAHAPLRDSGVPWIGEVPRHWEVRRVKHLCSCWNGLTYSPDDMSDDGIIVLRSGNIQNGKINLDDVVQVSMDIPEKAKAKKGDILICSRNGSKKLIGKNALITEDGYAFGAFMMIARPNIDSRYFYYLLNSEVFSYYLPTYLTSTVNQLTSSNFGNMYVPVTYDVAEQQEIARYLDEKTAQIDALVSAKQHQVQLLRELRASVIAEAVTGKLGNRD